ncbi:hypothetical protein [Candidatus Poriferisodalis sp.]|uniref:hypothetical protein n=1 Tax=Candidatus Poriferisodalis sp. TaxID=3101277 RepID=UPI003B02CCE4
MTAPIESIAAMTDQADDDTPSADAEPRPPAQPLPEAPLKPEAAALSAAPAASSVAAGARLRAARSVSPNAIIGLLGTLLVASLGAMTGLMMWQMSSLGDRIDRLDAKIDAVDNKIDTVHDKLVAKIDTLDVKLDAKIDNKIDGLRAEMQAGFREVNATLLDHTDRLARLETALGLPRPAHWYQ